MKNRFRLLLLSAAACAALNPLSAADAPLPPLFKNLGRHHHPVTTKYEMAQRYFDQGLTLCFNFNHAEAVRSFEAAAAIDPQCALGKNVEADDIGKRFRKAWRYSDVKLDLSWF